MGEEGYRVMLTEGNATLLHTMGRMPRETPAPR